MANRRLLFRISDIIIILLAIGLTAASAFKAYAKPKGTPQILIQGQRQKWIFPIDAEETVAVHGPIGNTIVRIHDRQAWVEYSPCENQTCVASGYIRQQRAWAACLPNNVFLIIEGNDGQGNNPDAVAW